MSYEPSCPFCKATQPERGWPFVVGIRGSGWQVMCPSCEARGPEGRTLDVAYLAWTSGRDTPPWKDEKPWRDGGCFKAPAKT